MTTALGALTSQFSALVVGKQSGDARLGEFAALAAVAPPGTKRGRVSSEAALVVYANNKSGDPRVSQVAALVVYSTATAVASRSLAWTFTLDGHTFYVLDLGEQGTFLFDTGTGSWSKWQTQGNVGWNFRNGAMWWTNQAPRIVGGDSQGPYVWEMDPLALFDEGWRDIEHAATAGIALRSRVYKSLAELRIAASAGQLDDTAGAAYIQLTYSDDNGQTFSDPVIVQLQVGVTPDGQQDIRFQSLGSFMAPGRVLQIADVGGPLRIDGVDAMIDNFDEANSAQPDGTA